VSHTIYNKSDLAATNYFYKPRDFDVTYRLVPRRLVYGMVAEAALGKNEDMALVVSVRERNDPPVSS